MQPGAPPAVIEAPEHWRVVEVISDLHLQASETATFAVWRQYMSQLAADALFILGDLFEVWVGDDMAQPGSFEADCAQVLKEAAARSRIFFLPGNRDFLVGKALSDRCGFEIIQDPTVLCWHSRRWVFSHGDALCLDDADYLRFRNEVRSPKWQSDFLSQSLKARLEIGKQLRLQSKLRQEQMQANGQPYADVDPNAARQILQQSQSLSLIHGHTHRPAQHSLGDGYIRTVLSDWDASACPPCAEILRLTKQPTGKEPANFSLERISLV
ncbi:MAG: UDP-2,3-diacylglucosamine hydrolase LpxH [Pseudomonadota bacterium]